MMAASLTMLATSAPKDRKKKCSNNDDDVRVPTSSYRKVVIKHCANKAESTEFMLR